jgi:hypothetical protein
MADIRKSGALPFDFQAAADQDPSPAPWTTVFGSSDTKIQDHALTGTVFPPTSSLSYWPLAPWGGRFGEAWGKGFGSPALTAGWRMALFMDPDTGPINGYQVLPQNYIGPDRWTLRRYDDGAFTTIGDVEYGLLTNHYAILRLEGPYVQCWRTDTAGQPNGTWTLVQEVYDDTYTGPFYPCFGTTGTECGWTLVGGTPYGGFIPQIIRRQHLRGDIPRSRQG